MAGRPNPFIKTFKKIKNSLIINGFMMPIFNMLFDTAIIYTQSSNTINIANWILIIISVLSVITLSVQTGRSYYVRKLRKFNNLLTTDMWMLFYLLIKDANIFLIVFIGSIMFWPAIYGFIPIAVPFAPLAIDFFAIAGLLIITTDVDENSFYNSILSVLTAIGAALYLAGFIFVTQNPITSKILLLASSPHSLSIWYFINANFNSLNNPVLAMWSFNICFSIFLACGVLATLYSFKGGIFKRLAKQKEILKPGQ